MGAGGRVVCAELPHFLQTYHPPSTSLRSEFLRKFLTDARSIKSLPLLINSVTSPSSFPEMRGRDWKVQPSNPVVGSSRNQPPSGSYLGAHQEPFISINSGKGSLWITKEIPISQKILRVLGVLCQEQGTKTKYTYLLLFHIDSKSRVLIHLCIKMQHWTGWKRSTILSIQAKEFSFSLSSPFPLPPRNYAKAHHIYHLCNYHFHMFSPKVY